MKHKNKQFTFNTVPTLKRPRTSFPLKYTTHFTLPIGRVCPYDIQEVVPGDTWSFSDHFVSRGSSALLRPVMDVAYVDYQFFFVPMRLVWKDWQKFITGSNGDGEPDDWTSEYEGEVPHYPENTTFPANSIFDGLGYPVGRPCKTPASCLPVRAVAKIFNDWYRDENVQKSVYIQLGDYNAEAEAPNTNEWAVNNYSGLLPKAGKFKDYFTSALPKPQKGDPVSISFAGNAPVSGNLPGNLGQVLLPSNEVQFFFQNGDDLFTRFSMSPKLGLGLNEDASLQVMNLSTSRLPSSAVLKANTGEFRADLYSEAPFEGTADLSQVSAFDINDFRLATQLQKLKERSARGGNRYTEYILSAFGVVPPDASLQRSEFLGGARIPLSQMQVLQTSESTETHALGDLGSISWTTGKAGTSKAFTEHGYIISCAVLRYPHTYQQGLPRMFSRLDRFSFYDPVFMNIGEQPIYASEIDARAEKDRVFGYKGAWDEYRYFPNSVKRQMRSTGAGGSVVSQDLFHYGDVYENVPVLSEQFIAENPAFMGRTFAVDPNEMDPLIVEVQRRGSVVREMPMWSIPSLLDHN